MAVKPILVVFLQVLLCAATVKPARACGLSPPIGPTGLPAVCHGDDVGPQVRVGVTAGGTSTKIDFGRMSASLLQTAATGTVDVTFFERLGLSGAVGSSLFGHLDYGGRRFELEPGPIGGLGVSYRLFGGTAPFVHASLTYSIARSTALAPDDTRTTFTSRDYRLGLAVGKTFGGFAAPFVVGRYFGGGTSWPGVGGHGGDHYRYHVGVGSAFGLSQHFDSLVELAFLGEKRATLGLGYVF
jgi:hypothetical protein